MNQQQPTYYNHTPDVVNTKSQEIKFETSLSSNILLNIVIVVVVFLIFPLLQYCMPLVYLPQKILNLKNTKLCSKIFWFIEVYQQPLSAYSYRGNLAVIYVIFCNMLSMAYFCIGVFSLTMLVPVYYYGTDQSFNTQYLTFWSKISISHLEGNTYMLIFPFLMITIITVIILQFYHQLKIVFIIFKQKTLRRTIPQNYVVMLQQIPNDIKHSEQLLNLIKPIQNGVVKLVLTPIDCNRLYQIHKQLKNIEDMESNYRIRIQLLQSQLKYLECSQKIFYKMTIKKLYGKINKISNVINNAQFIYREQKQLLQANLINTNNTIFNVCSNNKTENIQQNVQINESINLQQEGKQQVEKQLDSSQQNSHVHKEIGRCAFIICKDQLTTSEKCSTLIMNNSTQPKNVMAPMKQEIRWNKLNIAQHQKILYYILYLVVTISLFLLYLFGYTMLYALVNLLSKQYLYTRMCLNKGCLPQNIKQNTFKCFVCQMFSSLLITYAPSLCNAIINSCIPLFIELITTYILPVPTHTDTTTIEYRTLVTFLMMIMGLAQIIFPTMMNTTQGKLDFSQFVNCLNFNKVIQNFGTGIIDQQFTFFNYLITKYLLFPIFQLINLTGLWKALWNKMRKHNSLQYCQTMRSQKFKYIMHFAYISHTFVIALIFSISCPMISIIVILIFMIMQTINRYQILYIGQPDVKSELQAQKMLLTDMLTTIFVGLILMQIGMCCYFLINTGLFQIVQFINCVVCIIITILVKGYIDVKYDRAQYQMSKFQYMQATEFHYSPASNRDNELGLNKRKKSRYNLNNEDDLNCMKIENINQDYKMKIKDKLLKWIYFDFYDIPVSYIQIDSDSNNNNKSRKITILQDQQIDNYQITDEETKQICDYYTHPALNSQNNNFQMPQ